MATTKKVSKAKSKTKSKTKTKKTTRQTSRRTNPRTEQQLYATQGGGIAVFDELQKRYIFIKPPEWAPDLEFVPELWSVVPITETRKNPCRVIRPRRKIGKGKKARIIRVRRKICW